MQKLSEIALPTRTVISRYQSHALYGWFVCLLGALFYSYEFLLRIEPSVMVSQIMNYYQVTATGVGVLMSLYYWAYTPMQLFVGVFTDTFGSRRMLIVAIVFCALGSLMLYYTNNFALAGVARFIVGFGSAFGFVGVMKLAAMWLPRKYFAMFAGLTTSLGMVGAMGGDVFMAWSIKAYGWKHIFLISAVIGVMLAVLFIMFVKDKEHYKKKQKKHQANFFKLLFRTSHQFFSIIRHRQILCAGVIGCMLYLSLSIFAEAWGIHFMHYMLHGGVIKDAQINSLVFLGWLVGSPLFGWLSDHIGSRRLPLVYGSVLSGLCFILVLAFPHLSLVGVGVLLFLYGFFSSVEVICFAIARDLFPVNLAGTAVGAVNLLVMVGGMVLQPFASELLNIFSKQSATGTIMYNFHSYQLAMIIIPVGLLVSAIIAGFMLKESLLQRVPAKRYAEGGY